MNYIKDPGIIEGAPVRITVSTSGKDGAAYQYTDHYTTDEFIKAFACEVARKKDLSGSCLTVQVQKNYREA